MTTRRFRSRSNTRSRKNRRNTIRLHAHILAFLFHYPFSFLGGNDRCCPGKCLNCRYPPLQVLWSRCDFNQPFTRCQTFRHRARYVVGVALALFRGLVGYRSCVGTARCCGQVAMIVYYTPGYCISVCTCASAYINFDLITIISRAHYSPEPEACDGSGEIAAWCD